MSYDDPKFVAARKRLYAHTGSGRRGIQVAVAGPESDPHFVLYVEKKRQLHGLPKEWEGYEVIHAVMGKMRLCSEE